MMVTSMGEIRVSPELREQQSRSKPLERTPNTRNPGRIKRYNTPQRLPARVSTEETLSRRQQDSGEIRNDEDDNTIAKRIRTDQEVRLVSMSTAALSAPDASESRPSNSGI